MRSAALAAVAAACLVVAGCNTTKDAGTPAPAAASKLDAKIATVAATLKKYCGIASAALSTADAFISEPTVDAALKAGEVVVGAYCGGATPANTEEAIRKLADVAVAVAAAVATAQAK